MKTNRKRRDRLQRILSPVQHWPEFSSKAIAGQRDAFPAAVPAPLSSVRGGAEKLQTLFAEAVKLQRSGKLEAAVQGYQHALTLSPTTQERGAISCNLGQALLDLYRRDQALEACQQAVALLPTSIEALANLGNVLRELGRIEEARTAYETALRLNPEWLPAMHNLSTVLMEEGHFDQALTACESLLKLDPNFADARLNRAILRLLHGDFTRGWRDYEARLSIAKTMTPKPHGEMPQWRGEPLAGTSILLYAEQGLGDAIQFLRYVPMVSGLGGEVTLVLPSRLMRLAGGLGVRIIAEGEALPVCEWQSPLMSLPLAIATQTGEWTIPPWKPYLTVPQLERIRAKSLSWPASTLRVGLVWSGTPHHTRDWARSIALDLLAPLLTLPYCRPGLQFYALQAGPAVRQIEPWRERILDLAPLEHDMSDTAAKILELDLLIAVDTSVAHLAGALGKPVWLMVPSVPDWRWQLQREDSPWYPKMRIFRQPERHAWTPVIERIRQELLLLVEQRSREQHSQNHSHDQPDEGSRRIDAVSRQGSGDSGAEQAGTEQTRSGNEDLQTAVVSSARQSCKICGGSSPLFGVVDFHKSCMEGQGKRLMLSGVPVYYRRCEQCGFLATEFFDRWPETAFNEHLYNANYLLVDPDAEEQRPAGNARLIAEAFAAARTTISILDYGGGSGRFAELMSEQGFTVETYDPFSKHCQRPQKRFDLITCFEVLEHAPDPHGIVASMRAMLKSHESDGEDGLILFSTLLQPEDIAQIGVNWWYAAPRNGHCSLYTASALARLFAASGMQTASANPALHLAYRRVPGFASHLRIGNAEVTRPA